MDESLDGGSVKQGASIIRIGPNAIRQFFENDRQVGSDLRRLRVNIFERQHDVKQRASAGHLFYAQIFYQPVEGIVSSLVSLFQRSLYLQQESPKCDSVIDIIEDGQRVCGLWISIPIVDGRTADDDRGIS